MPLFRRYRRPGLLDAVGQSAVVAGTESMTSRAVRRAAERAGQGNMGNDSAPWPEVTSESSLAEGLKALSELHSAGDISDEEFALAKSRLLRN